MSKIHVREIGERSICRPTTDYVTPHDVIELSLFQQLPKKHQCNHCLKKLLDREKLIKIKDLLKNIELLKKMSVRIELIGGQNTRYIQRDEVLAYIEPIEEYLQTKEHTK